MSYLFQVKAEKDQVDIVCPEAGGWGCSGDLHHRCLHEKNKQTLPLWLLNSLPGEKLQLNEDEHFHTDSIQPQSQQ